MPSLSISSNNSFWNICYSCTVATEKYDQNCWAKPYHLLQLMFTHISGNLCYQVFTCHVIGSSYMWWQLGFGYKPKDF